METLVLKEMLTLLPPEVALGVCIAVGGFIFLRWVNGSIKKAVSELGDKITDSPRTARAQNGSFTMLINLTEKVGKLEGTVSEIKEDVRELKQKEQADSDIRWGN